MCRSPHSESNGGTAAERLTDDLLLEILSRVPVKSLCRFKCVSNHWLNLIDHPAHRKTLPQTLASFLYDSSNTEDWLLNSPVHFTSFPGRHCPQMDTSFAFLPNHQRLEFFDCCNGLLLCILYQGDDSFYVVCNPATEKWVVLPDSEQPGMTARLGFDPALSSHFHVFELVTKEGYYPELVGVAVYSSETGRWVYKENRWTAPIALFDLHLQSVFVNGYLHFQANRHGSRLNWLAVVDTEGETWMNFDVPGGLYDGFIQWSQDQLYYGNLQTDEGVGLRLALYVLDNYQSKEWILKHSIQASYVYPGGEFDWVAIRPECSLIFFTIRSGQGIMKFMCYNMERWQVKEISTLEDVKLPYLPYVPLYVEFQSLRI